MRFDPTYQNRYMTYPMNREQDGYAMNGYAPPPPGTLFPFSFQYPPPFMVHVHSALDSQTVPANYSL